MHHEKKSDEPDLTLPLDIQIDAVAANSKSGRRSRKPSSLRPHTSIAPKVEEKTPPGRLSDGLLRELQKEVATLESERGTSKESLAQKSLILTEEAFEVIKVLRIHSGIATTPGNALSLADELADVLFVSAAIANRIPTDLSENWCAHINPEYDPPKRPEILPEDRILSASVGLAREVLTIVVGLTDSENGIQVANQSSAMIARLVDDLTSLLEAVEHVAIESGINLRNAVEEKLGKDQLRLWK